MNFTQFEMAINITLSRPDNRAYQCIHMYWVGSQFTIPNP